MKNKITVAFVLLMLLVATLPIAFYVKPVLASPSGPSLVVRDNVNRINATAGAKSGSQITVKGTVTNIGPTSWTGLLTGVFF